MTNPKAIALKQPTLERGIFLVAEFLYIPHRGHNLELDPKIERFQGGGLEIPAELARRIRRYLEKPNSRARRDNASRKKSA